LAQRDYRIKKKKSPYPFIAVGIWWIIFALLFRLDMWYHYLVAAAMSVFVYWLFSRIFPGTQFKIDKPYRAPLSGDMSVDRTIREAEATLNNVWLTTGKITVYDSIFAGNVAGIITDGKKILEYLSGNTSKIAQLRRLFSYYLPTLDKLLKNYLVLIKHEGDRDFTESKEDIEESVKMMQTVFSKQLSKLLDDVALDISTDKDVLEIRLAQSGYKTLTEEDDR
jgi:hypothetical protein